MSNFNYFFENIEGNAEELLLVLGFGPTDPMTKIPARFMRPSSLKGISYDPMESIVSSSPLSNCYTDASFASSSSNQASLSQLSRSSTLSSDSSRSSASSKFRSRSASLSRASSFASSDAKEQKISDAKQKKIPDACCRTETPKKLDRLETPTISRLDANLNMKNVSYNNLKLSFELYKKHLMKFTINCNQDERHHREDLASVIILKNRFKSEMALIDTFFDQKFVGVDLDSGVQNGRNVIYDSAQTLMNEDQLIRRMASLTKIIQSATIKIVTKRLNL